jgi:cobalamin biosynthesis Co2+ chelatase CbiK
MNQYNNMTTLQKFQQLANIEFVDQNGDIEIGTLQTADGYDLHYITTDVQNLQFDMEVYYYQPDFDAIMNAIDDLRCFKPTSEIVSVACYDVDDYFDEYYMLDYISDNVDEEEFEKFSNTLQTN